MDTRENAEKYKFHVQFHITNRCNLNCKHCYEGYKGRIVDWDYEEFKKAIEKLWSCFHKWDVQGEISLIGGEPTLHPEFFEMVDYLHNRGDVSSIAILTNGTNISDQLIESAIRNKCGIQVSIDGVNETQHDSIRGIGTYKKTVENISKLTAAGILVSVHTVLSKNIYPITKEFFYDLEELGVQQITLSRLVPFGNASTADMLTREELRKVFCDIALIKKELKDSINISTTRPLWCNMGYSGRCPVGIQTITVLENGDLMPCRRLPIVLGNIKIDSFYKVWYTNTVLERLRDRTKIKKCGLCTNLDKCGGARCIAYATSGDYLGEDPQCWL